MDSYIYTHTSLREDLHLTDRHGGCVVAVENHISSCRWSGTDVVMTHPR